MQDRIKTHFRINTRLSMLSDKRLKSLLSKAKLTKGWGQNGVVKIDGQRVFVKIIPLTCLEMENAFSTKNLYRIPTWYNYGVGSAGFGAFRELATHVKTTNWVLDNQFTAFPLLHHHRILTMKDRAQNSSPDLNDYVKYWNGSKTIERYMKDRATSSQHLYLFLEHLTPLSDWMGENPSKMNGMFRKALKGIDFLKQQGMIHFDAHMHNWLTDGQNMYLSDFGLLLDQEFELTKSEHQFFKSHRDYDYAQVVETFGYALVHNYFSLNPDKVELAKKAIAKYLDPNDPYLNSQINVILALHKKKIIILPSYVVTYIRRYGPIMNTKNQFFQDIRKGKKASDRYPARKLRKLLRQLEVVR